MAARSKAWLGVRSLAGIVGSNPTRGMDGFCVLTGRGLCAGLITLPGDSYRVFCVGVS